MIVEPSTAGSHNLFLDKQLNEQDERACALIPGETFRANRSAYAQSGTQIWKDLKQLQQRDKRIHEKIAEARQAQARAMKRFAEAQERQQKHRERITQLEADLRTAREQQNGLSVASPEEKSSQNSAEITSTTNQKTEPLANDPGEITQIVRHALAENVSTASRTSVTGHTQER